ncbi:flagellar basal body P-ring formation chaperone FlgA [Candidatus Riflebacteria bacterium]
MRWVGFFLLFLTCCSAPVRGKGTAMLTFMPQLVTEKNRISAFDICENPPANSSERQSLKSLLLGHLSPYKLTLRVDKKHLILRLKSVFKEKYQYQIQSSIYIYKKTFNFPVKKISSLIRQNLQLPLSELGLKSENLIIKFLKTPKTIILPFNPQKVTLQNRLSKILGHHNLTFVFKNNEKKTLRRKVRVEISLKGKTLVAKNKIEENTKISKNNTNYAEKILRNMRQLEQVTGPHDFGKTTLVTIMQGKIIRRNEIFLPHTIKKYQTVPMILEQGNIRLSGHIISLEDGYIGEVIRLKNKKTRQILFGRIQKDGSVRISL